MRARIVFMAICACFSRNISDFVISFKFVCSLSAKKKGVLERLASNRLGLELKGGYLVVYFILLLFSLGGLMLQGGVYLLIGGAAWFSVVFGWFICYRYRNNAPSLKATALSHKGPFGGEE